MRVSLLSAALLLLSGAALAGIDGMVEDCNGCHGEQGVSQWQDVPTIADIDPFTHANALYVYRDAARPCVESSYRRGDTERPAKTMCQVVADLSDDDIEALAAHYADLPFVAAKQPFDAALAAAGEALHKEHCARCHSDGGSNPEDEASILAGQQMGYLERTFAEYVAGEREQPKKMKVKLDPLTSEEIKALLHYYGSQQ